MKECPYCKEMILDDAIKCRYCREWIVDRKKDNSQETEVLTEQKEKIEIQSDAKKCPNCGLINPETAIYCDCGYNFKDETYKIKTRPKPKVHPWWRYWARIFDYYLFSFLCGLFLISKASSILDLSDIVLGLLILIIWIPFEAILLSSWGTTPGKWLLETKVLNSKEEKLTFGDALNRSFSVWLKGLGAGIPIITLITLIISHNKLRDDGITTWDQKDNFIVKHGKINPAKVIIMVLLFIGFFYLISEASKTSQLNQTY